MVIYNNRNKVNTDEDEAWNDEISDNEFENQQDADDED